MEQRSLSNHDKINYLEFPSRDITKTKAFFSAVFDWTFTDYGPEYTAFANAGTDGGFFLSAQASTTDNGGALVVFFSDSLEQTQAAIEAAGGVITRSIFSFPGGRRFHFIDPNGNEYAVWSNQ
jgi:predicted enzyme related to lactoylglutathione lyase|tara:strand:+ start:337 stop:705 length:369 start_codon:yes stop_codon:yes gene_type:complete